MRWRQEQTVQCVPELVDMVHSIRPGLPVVGSSVCFGDPGWTVNCSLEIERLAELEDIVRVEIQTRFWFDPDGSGGDRQCLRWPAETANYMTTVSDRPVRAATFATAGPPDGELRRNLGSEDIFAVRRRWGSAWWITLPIAAG